MNINKSTVDLSFQMTTAIEFSEIKSKDNQPAGTTTNFSLQSLHNPVSPPILGVPLDVLQEIIFYCLPAHPTIQSASPIISTLSRVSSTWRAAVLSSPRLWSTLFVTVRYDDDLNKCAQVVTQWFQRARSAPLSFFLNIRFKAQTEDITRIHTFLADLSLIMPKVWHFALHAHLTSPLLSSFLDLDWKFPQLKILDLFSHSYSDKLNAIAFSSPLFHNIPNLVQVAIQNTITSAHDIQHVLPWSQLIHITIAYNISVSRWIEIMNMCPKLRRFELVLDKSDSCLPKPKGVHNLEHLELDINGQVSFLKPLSLFILPSLNTLSVVHSEPFFDSTSPQGISALTNLQKFSFNSGGKRFSREHITYLAEVLHEMVDLKVLLLHQTTQDFIPLYGAMSFGSPEVPMLPQLGTLQLWITTHSEVQLPEKDEELQPLIEMLSSRSREDTIPVGYKPLRDVTVGVESDDIYERTKKRFGSLNWVGFPPQFRFSITLLRDYRFEQPEGWTYPISDPTKFD